MSDDILDDIVENVLRVIPLIRGSFLNIDLDCVADGLAHPHLMVLKVLQEHEKLPASTIGSRQFISRPQMTHIIDKLEAMGMVQRMPDAADRRVTNVRLTDKGRAVVLECDAFIKRNLKDRLAVLSNEDIEEMSAALGRLAQICARLRQAGG